MGGSYDFGVLKLMGELSQVKDKAETTMAPSSAGRTTFRDNDAYNGAMIGITVPLGAGVFKASYARVKFKNDLGSVALTVLAPDRDASVNNLALGYVHNLSKRTALYATVARARIRTGQNNPAIMAVGLGGPAFSSTGSGTVGLAQRNGLRLRAASRILKSDISERLVPVPGALAIASKNERLNSIFHG